jgi:hypothetical protein
MNNCFFKGAGRGSIALAGGIVLACAASPAAFAQSCYNNSNPNLVQNGDFESGSVGSTIPHWNVSWHGNSSDGKPVDPYVNVGNDNPHDGNQELDLGTTLGANDITQPIKSTIAGDIYTVCFWLASAPNQIVGKTSFDVLWNDVSELELTQSAESPYQYYAFIVTGTPNDHLRFRERNDKGYYYLDDVAIQLCTGCAASPQFKKR